LSLEFLSLDVRDKEGGYKVLNNDLRLVPSLFHPVDELVKSVSLKLGLLVSLEARGVINSVDKYILEIRIDCTLVD
jgi:hypothetical protein